MAATRFTESGMDLIADDAVEVIVEITGSSAAGVAHALAAAKYGKPIIMVNVEADVLAGPLLAEAHRKAGTVYSMAYGDQPALVCELVDWARMCGFDVVAAGKGTKYQPFYHDVTPANVWEHYGLNADHAAAAGMNAQMFNSFLDGTKSAIEMAAIANATGLDVPHDGLGFPVVARDELQSRLIPIAEGGVLEGKGQVEVIASAQRGADAEMPNNLRWGVYVVFEAHDAYARACFAQYGLKTDPSGRYAALYRPYHLIGFELGISVVNVVLRGEPTGATRLWQGDVVAVAKRDLAPGDVLDGEGGYCAWGKLVPARRSLAIEALPIGLAYNLKLVHPVARGEIVTRADVETLPSTPVVETRRAMEQTFGT
jgi:predicted homoserine dehydrogenase-like protein